MLFPTTKIPQYEYTLIEKSKGNVLSFSIQINVFILKIQGGEGSGWRGSGGGETHVYPWPIHVDVWQNHHNIVK